MAVLPNAPAVIDRAGCTRPVPAFAVHQWKPFAKQPRPSEGTVLEEQPRPFPCPPPPAHQQRPLAGAELERVLGELQRQLERGIGNDVRSTRLPLQQEVD